MANWIWNKYKANEKYKYVIQETRATSQARAWAVSTNYSEIGITSDGSIYGTGTRYDYSEIDGLDECYQVIIDQSFGETYKKGIAQRCVPDSTKETGLRVTHNYKGKKVNDGYTQGSYIGEVVAPESAYTNNARNSDGYWYVKDRLANQAPSISGVDEDLGVKNKAFQVSFKVQDGDLTQSLTVTTRLNGTQISEYLNATRDQDYIIDITDEMLKGLELNKKNTINITVSDGTVTANRNWYFTRTNQAPVISVGNSNFGEQNKEFEFTFSATDPDGDAMTAKVYIDGVQVEDIGAVVDGHENTYKIKREDFIVLKNGEHKIRIDITDAVGSASSSFITFTKKVTWYLYEYKEELPSQPTDIRVDMLANLAEGIERKIEVCNNALDTKPTWETIEEGKWTKFTNSKKTAEKWGLGVRVRIDRGTATQDSYVYGFNISYV